MKYFKFTTNENIAIFTIYMNTMIIVFIVITWPYIVIKFYMFMNMHQHRVTFYVGVLSRIVNVYIGICESWCTIHMLHRNYSVWLSIELELLACGIGFSFIYIYILYLYPHMFSLHVYMSYKCWLQIIMLVWYMW